VIDIVRDDLGRPFDVVSLSGLEVRCIVGVYPAERSIPQRLRVDVALYLDGRPSAAGADLSRTVDYARLSGELRFLLEACRFSLLEHAADALLRYVLAPPTPDAPRAQVMAATVRLSKPDALEGVAVPSLQVHRRAEECEYAVEEKGFGQVDILHEGPAHGIYRLRIRPGGCIHAHVHRVMDEHELVLGTGLLLQGRPVLRGTVLHWPRDFAHRYDNPTEVAQTVLCVDCPAFVPSDEIEVDVATESLLPVTGTSYYPVGDAERVA
jgi:FolB domain-containing protein